MYIQIKLVFHLLLIKQNHELLEKNEVRRLIKEEKIRPDGRKIDEVRPLNAQIPFLVPATMKSISPKWSSIPGYQLRLYNRHLF